MGNENEIFTRPCLLVTEGNDDVVFFRALARNLKIENDLQIIKTDGRYNLRIRLNAIKNTDGWPSVCSFGIVVDADTNCENRFRGVADALKKANLPVPERCSQFVGNNPATGVYILPDEHTPGELEDLCLSSVTDDPAIVCTERYFACLKEEGVEYPKKLSKARLQAFLASRPEVRLQLGHAAQKGYFPWDNPVFDDVKNFLIRLVSVS